MEQRKKEPLPTASLANVAATAEMQKRLDEQNRREKQLVAQKKAAIEKRRKELEEQRRVAREEQKRKEEAKKQRYLELEKRKQVSFVH